MAVSEDMRYVVDIQDVDTDDPEEVEFAMDTVYQCAASAVADVCVSLLVADMGGMLVEISGHYTEVSAFQRRWDAEL